MRNHIRKFSVYLEGDFKGEIKGKGETIFHEILVENFTQLRTAHFFRSWEWH